jgi:hypothetical protein
MISWALGGTRRLTRTGIAKITLSPSAQISGIPPGRRSNASLERATMTSALQNLGLSVDQRGSTMNPGQGSQSANFANTKSEKTRHLVRLLHD